MRGLGVRLIEEGSEREERREDEHVEGGAEGLEKGDDMCTSSHRLCNGKT